MSEKRTFYFNPVTGEIIEIPRNKSGSIMCGFKNEFDARAFMEEWDILTAALRGEIKARYNPISKKWEIKK